MDLARIIPAKSNNSTRNLDYFSPEITKYVLIPIGSIFIKHGLHKRFAVACTHRQHDVPNSYVMVHRKEEGERWCDVCRPRDVTALSGQTLHPHSLMFDNGKLVPYEYG